MIAVAATLAVAILLSPNAGRGQELNRRSPAAPAAVDLPLRYADAGRAAQRLTVLLGSKRDVAIVADEATNTVFIRAPEETVRQAREILGRLDVPVQFYIIHLDRVDATRIARLLQGILTLTAALSDGCLVYVTADGKANQILLSAPAEQMRQAREVLRWLDEQHE